MNAQISVANVSVRQFDNLYSLNDLHKASGGEPRHKPSNWLANKQTTDLIAEIEIAGIPAIQKKQGLGTFVCKELVVLYGMWISPAFSLKVIRAFLDTQEDVSGSPKLEAQTTIDERRGLVDAVKLLVARCGIDYSAAYRMVHQRFGVAHIDQIAAPLLPSAVAYVHSLMLHNGISGEVLDRLPENLRPAPLSLRNLHGALLHGMYCAQFIYRHREALRMFNRRLAANISHHATDGIAMLRDAAAQAGMELPDNRYFHFFPWDGDYAEKQEYYRLNA